MVTKKNITSIRIIEDKIYSTSQKEIISWDISDNHTASILKIEETKEDLILI